MNDRVGFEPMGKHLTPPSDTKRCTAQHEAVERGGAEHAGIGDSALHQAVNQKRRVLFSERASKASRRELTLLTEEE